VNESVIDQGPLDAIRALQQPGNESLLDTILELYLDQSVELAARIGRAVADSCANDLREAAHSLKSSSANVGAMLVYELARELEAVGRGGNTEGAAELCSRLELAVGDANTALGSILSDRAT